MYCFLSVLRENVLQVCGFIGWDSQLIGERHGIELPLPVKLCSHFSACRVMGYFHFL